MLEPNCTILYVDSPLASAAFYANILGREALEAAPTFAMFVLQNGSTLGLWSKHTVEPAPTATGGGTELGFTLDSVAAVDALYARWQQQGLPMLQAPTSMDFGYTFVALDPDGHRLRVFVLQEG